MTFLTDKKKDFYVPRCNERQEMVNWFVPFKDSKGVHGFFVLKKMKDSYYERVTPSENFMQAFSEKADLDGEWNTHDLTKPVSDNEKDVFNTLIFTVANLDHFKSKLKDDAFVNMAKNPNTALQAINGLVQEGIVKRENEENQPTTLIDTIKKGEKAGKRRSLNLWCENTMKKVIPTPEV